MPSGDETVTDDGAQETNARTAAAIKDPFHFHIHYFRVQLSLTFYNEADRASVITAFDAVRGHMATVEEHKARDAFRPRIGAIEKTTVIVAVRSGQPIRAAGVDIADKGIIEAARSRKTYKTGHLCRRPT